jgi:hypothetical protein
MADAGSSWRARARRWFPSVVLWFGLAVCAATISRGTPGTGGMGQLLEWPTVAGIALAITGIFGSAVVAWRLLVSEAGALRLPVHIAIEHVGMLQIGKYIPGKIFGIVARASASVPGFPGRALMGATLHEQLISMGCTLLVGAALSISTIVRPGIVLVLVLLVVPAVAAVVYPSAWQAFARPVMRLAVKMTGDIGTLPTPSKRTTASVAASFTVQWLAVGGLIALVLESQQGDASSWMAVTGAYALATIGGMMALVVPGGIGVREAMFVGLAAPVVDQPMAITLAAMLRLVLSLMDLAGGALAISIRKLRG